MTVYNAAALSKQDPTAEDEEVRYCVSRLRSVPGINVYMVWVYLY